jgi:hypothetical protein
MRVIRLLLCGLVLSAWSLMANAADYDALKPLLADVADWTGEAAEGSSMAMEGVTLVTANRHYQRGEAQSLDAQLSLMPGAMAAPIQATMNMNMETDDAVITTSTIDGFLVHHNHEKAQNSGDVVVILGGDDKRSAMFTMSYTGINAQEALAMAKRFDWKKMQAAAAALH